jgi:hypothetical protein
MDRRLQAGLVPVGALALGAIVNDIAKQEAAVLGLSMIELGILSLAVGTVARGRVF